MADRSDEIAFRLWLRWDSEAKRGWLVVPLEIGGRVTLAMAPNTIATRSVIAPPALQLLRAEGLIGANIYDIQTGSASCVPAGCRLGGHPIPDLETRVRDIDRFRNANGDYLVDGSPGSRFPLRGLRLARDRYADAAGEDSAQTASAVTDGCRPIAPRTTGRAPPYRGG